MNSILTVALIGGVTLTGTALYFSYKRKKELQPVMKQEEIDKLTLAYVVDYFKEKKGILTKGTEPIALKIKEGNLLNMSLENTDEYQYVLLTYYNEKEQKVLTENSLLVKTKCLDINLTDAFKGRDMLILS